MVKWLQLTLTDFRNVLREQLLWFMFIIAPVLQFLMAKFGVPWLIGYFPIIDDYREIALIFMTVQICSGIGFVMASILLDERDEEIHTAIRILPVSTAAFLAYRLGITTIITFLFSWAMITFSGLAGLSLQQSVAASLLFAIIAPIVTLAMASLSRNKVEGLAMFKVLNLILLVPVVGLFLVPPIQYAFGLIPMYWSYQYLASAGGRANGWLWFLGLGYHLVLLVALFRIFSRRFYR